MPKKKEIGVHETTNVDTKSLDVDELDQLLGLSNALWIHLPCGCGSPVVKVTDSLLTYHEFESSAAEDPPCREADAR
ncbi:hypothetical protein TNCV_3077811 [Trichonephila clavipes]|nr:hypothetical protein TNCV_3077811 [Trichonephila clavipes]